MIYTLVRKNNHFIIYYILLIKNYKNTLDLVPLFIIRIKSIDLRQKRNIFEL